MSEPITSLDEIADIIVPVTLTRPDGKHVTVNLRSLSESEVWEIRQKIKWPEAPFDLQKVSGRVTYSQQILKEFGWIDEGKGIGFERPGSGYSQI